MQIISSSSFPKYLYRATGDGNCLFNACSISLIGDESLSVFLRCLASIEIFEHSSYYADHPLLFGHSLNGREMNEDSIFSNIISQVAFDSFKKGDRVPAVLVEARNVAVNFSYSSFLCLLALSSVIGMSIESYYPMKSEIVNDVYELLYNTTVFPRPETFSHSQDTNVHIFRCASMPLEYISSTEIPADKNHFVPLMPTTSDALKFSPPSAFLKSPKSQKHLPNSNSRLPNHMQVLNQLRKRNNSSSLFLIIFLPRHQNQMF